MQHSRHFVARTCLSALLAMKVVCETFADFGKIVIPVTHF